jgi:hypothetical protein
MCIMGGDSEDGRGKWTGVAELEDEVLQFIERSEAANTVGMWGRQGVT